MSAPEAVAATTASSSTVSASASASAPAAAPANSANGRTASGKTRARPAEREHRVAGQPGFVLHSYPYKETSLIVEVFTREYGRVPLIALSLIHI